jgi:asparagine synthase (glutamine-hydrolysing)
MCGIAGFVTRAGDADADPDALARMLAQVAHRGPDGQGEWRGTLDDAGGAWRVALGHRRLAIIDLATGAQPMDNEDGSVVITFNGEIYNFAALRPALERAGHRFKTRSDTETIIHHLEQHGEGGVRDLSGMFAFALWDARAGRLTLARDRVGIKPLYYAEVAGGGIVFASELAAVLAHGGIDGTLSAEGLASYFFSDYVHPPHTIVRGVKKLPPGHTVVWERGRLGAPRAFWQVPLAPGSAVVRGADGPLAEELWRRLGDAVEAQLVSDVPVGIFLSGGVDSSCVAALAAKRAPGRMKAFSIGFDTKTFDESDYARLVAGRLGVEHIVETLREETLLDVLDPALDRLDEPLGDPSYLPTFLLSRLAARHVKVVVGGDGGDELWAGYPTYRAHRYAAIYGKIPAPLRALLSTQAIDRLPVDHRYQSLEWKLRRFTQRYDDDRVRRHLRWMSALDLPDLATALGRAGNGLDGLTPATLATRLPGDGSDWLNQILALDFTTYMPGSVLTKVDRASMAHGLEVRPPLLDNQVVDWAFSLSSRYKLRGTQGKYLLKRAAQGSVPDEVIHRPKKGFAIPLARWLAGPLRPRLDALVASSPVWDLGVLDQPTFATWNREHHDHQRDRSKPLWALLVLDHWLRRLPAFYRRGGGSQVERTNAAARASAGLGPRP